VRYSRHAKNRMRLYGVNRAEIAEVVLSGWIVGADSRGLPIFEGETRDGRSMQVVMAVDVPNFVVTVIGEGR